VTGFLSAVVAAILFGVGGTFAQYLFQNRGINTEWLVTMRLLGAGSVLLVLSAARDWRATMAIWRDRRDVLQVILFGVVGMMPVQYTYFAAIHASNTATATVLQYTGPAMIAVWLALRGRRWPTRREYGAIVLALAGTFFLVAQGDFRALSISPLALFWGLASAAAAAFNSLQPAGLLRKHGAAHVTGWGMLIGGIALSFVHAPWRVEGVWDTRSYLFVAFILIFGTLAAFYLYLKAVHMIGAQKSALLTCAEPLSAAVLAVWWLGVSFGAMDWLGTICILATIVLLSQAQSEESQSEKVT
jgi:drug/metabolite transporter (DMT)-like permease